MKRSRQIFLSVLTVLAVCLYAAAPQAVYAEETPSGDNTDGGSISLDLVHYQAQSLTLQLNSDHLAYQDVTLDCVDSETGKPVTISLLAAPGSQEYTLYDLDAPVEELTGTLNISMSLLPPAHRWVRRLSAGKRRQSFPKNRKPRRNRKFRHSRRLRKQRKRLPNRKTRNPTRKHCQIRNLSRRRIPPCRKKPRQKHRILLRRNLRQIPGHPPALTRQRHRKPIFRNCSRSHRSPDTHPRQRRTQKPFRRIIHLPTQLQAPLQKPSVPLTHPFWSPQRTRFFPLRRRQRNSHPAFIPLTGSDKSILYLRF